jgi:hypothetical protein
MRTFISISKFILIAWALSFDRAECVESPHRILNLIV